MGITPFAIMRKEAYPITYFPSAFISNKIFHQASSLGNAPSTQKAVKERPSTRSKGVVQLP